MNIKEGRGTKWLMRVRMPVEEKEEVWKKRCEACEEKLEMIDKKEV